MSKTRRDPRAGWVSTKDLPRGPNGRCLCRECGKEVPKGRRTFCGPKCVDAWKWKTNPQFVRRKLYERDTGICASCGLDTREIERMLELLRKLAMGDWKQRRPGMSKLERFRGLILTELKVGHRKSFWDADHIVPVKQGGGGCGPENYQTLCIWCHRAKSGKQAK